MIESLTVRRGSIRVRATPPLEASAMAVSAEQQSVFISMLTRYSGFPFLLDADIMN
jgi:hypothetical protein